MLENALPLESRYSYESFGGFIFIGNSSARIKWPIFEELISNKDDHCYWSTSGLYISRHVTCHIPSAPTHLKHFETHTRNCELLTSKIDIERK